MSELSVVRTREGFEGERMAGGAEGPDEADWSSAMLESSTRSGGLLALEHRFSPRSKVLLGSVSFSKSPESRLSESPVVYKFRWAVSCWESPTTDRSLKAQFACSGVGTGAVT